MQQCEDWLGLRAHRIEYVLHEHEARLVREEEIDAFAEEVRREARN